MATKKEEPEAKPFRPPVLTANYRSDIERAASVHVDANRSDPFAGSRIRSHMKGGLALPSEVTADAQARLAK